MTNEEKLRVLEREVAEWVSHRDFMHRAEPSGWVDTDNLALAEGGAEAMTWALAIVKAAAAARGAIFFAQSVAHHHCLDGDAEALGSLLDALNDSEVTE